MMKRIRQKITAALLILALVSGEAGQTGVYVRAEDGNGLTEYTEEYTEEDTGTEDTGEQSGTEVENAGNETGP